MSCKCMYLFWITKKSCQKSYTLYVLRYTFGLRTHPNRRACNVKTYNLKRTFDAERAGCFVENEAVAFEEGT